VGFADRARLQDKVRLIRDRLMRTELLPAFEMSDAKVEGFIARIREVRPRMVFGYPSAISHIAGYAEKKASASTTWA
jgi:phenylacetate-CoA ligase